MMADAEAAERNHATVFEEAQGSMDLQGDDLSEAPAAKKPLLDFASAPQPLTPLKPGQPLSPFNPGSSSHSSPVAPASLHKESASKRALLQEGEGERQDQAAVAPAEVSFARWLGGEAQVDVKGGEKSPVTPTSPATSPHFMQSPFSDYPTRPLPASPIIPTFSSPLCSCWGGHHNHAHPSGGASNEHSPVRKAGGSSPSAASSSSIPPLSPPLSKRKNIEMVRNFPCPPLPSALPPLGNGSESSAWAVPGANGTAAGAEPPRAGRRPARVLSPEQRHALLPRIRERSAREAKLNHWPPPRSNLPAGPLQAHIVTSEDATFAPLTPFPLTFAAGGPEPPLPGGHTHDAGVPSEGLQFGGEKVSAKGLDAWDPDGEERRRQPWRGSREGEVVFGRPDALCSCQHHGPAGNTDFENNLARSWAASSSRGLFPAAGGGCAPGSEGQWPWEGAPPDAFPAHLASGSSNAQAQWGSGPGPSHRWLPPFEGSPPASPPANSTSQLYPAGANGEAVDGSGQGGVEGSAAQGKGTGKTAAFPPPPPKAPLQRSLEARQKANEALRAAVEVGQYGGVFAVLEEHCLVADLGDLERACQWVMSKKRAAKALTTAEATRMRQVSSIL